MVRLPNEPIRWHASSKKTWVSSVPTGWTDEELAASVEAYKAMAEHETAGGKYNKKQIYRDLAEKFGRTPEAFERRMMNISALYDELGLSWVPGLRPAAHIGADVRRRLLTAIQGPPTSVRAGKNTHDGKRTWEWALDAIAALNGSASRTEVREWLLINHPTYNDANLVDLETLSVNSPSRTSFNQNKAPRFTNAGSPYDQLFKTGQGKTVRFEFYVPAVHGIWEIYPDPGSGNRFGMGVRRADDPVSSSLNKVSAEVEGTSSFSPQNVEDARQKVLTEIYRRRGQSGFRDALRRAYKDACAITGCTFLPILEAAHIHPYKGQHTNVASNGLLLRTDIHTLFDLYLVAINPSTMTTLIAPALSATEYSMLAGKSVRIPETLADRASIEALDWHRGLCQWSVV